MVKKPITKETETKLSADVTPLEERVILLENLLKDTDATLVAMNDQLGDLTNQLKKLQESGGNPVVGLKQIDGDLIFSQLLSAAMNRFIGDQGLASIAKNPDAYKKSYNDIIIAVKAAYEAMTENFVVE